MLCLSTNYSHRVRQHYCYYLSIPLPIPQTLNSSLILGDIDTIAPSDNDSNNFYLFIKLII